MFEVGAFYAFKLVVFGRIDEIKESGKRIAEIETSPASMTDVELTAQLGIKLVGVDIIRICPIDNVPCRRVQAAFSHYVTGSRD